MIKNFQAQTYIVDDNLSDTLSWLCQHQECFDSFHYDAIRQTLTVRHANVKMRSSKVIIWMPVMVF